MKKLLSGFLMIILLLALSGACADPDLTLQDTAVLNSSWAEAYSRILTERSGSIGDYQQYVTSVTYSTECRPVALRDLTGDGIPELLFIDLVKDTEYGFEVGRLWIYTADWTGVHCMLSLQPEIDDLLYSTVYLGADGLLTLHFSDTEMGWTIRLQPDMSGHYKTETVLTDAMDFSGEGPDLYYLNGSKISEKKYKSEAKKIQSARGTLIGSLMVDDGYSGFDYTLEEAQAALLSADVSGAGQSGAEQAAGRFPELTFTLGDFTPGEKFAVYSAPSSKSWRGANGKASITSGSEIFVAGSVDGWILILYELDSGVVRAGYINADKIKGDYSAGKALTFASETMTLKEAAVMTDDPIRGNGTMGKLKKGTTVTCLAEFRGWIYVEAKISGKTARGFISPASLGLE